MATSTSSRKDSKASQGTSIDTAGNSKESSKEGSEPKLSIAAVAMTKSILKRRRTAGPELVKAQQQPHPELQQQQQQLQHQKSLDAAEYEADPRYPYCDNCDTKIVFSFNISSIMNKVNHSTTSGNISASTAISEQQSKESNNEEDENISSNKTGDKPKIIQWHPLKPWILTSSDKSDVIVWNYATNTAMHIIDTKKLFVSNKYKVIQAKKMATSMPSDNSDDANSLSAQPEDGTEKKKRRSLLRMLSGMSSSRGESPMKTSSSSSSMSDRDSETFASEDSNKGSKDYPVGKVLGCGFFDSDVLKYTSLIPFSMVDGITSSKRLIFIVCQRAIILYDYEISQVADIMPTSLFFSSSLLEGFSSSISCSEFSAAYVPISHSHLAIGTSHGAILICNLFEKKTSLVLGDVKKYHGTRATITSITMLHGYGSPFRVRFASSCSEGKVIVWEISAEPGATNPPSCIDTKILSSSVMGLEKIFPAPSSSVAVTNLYYDPILRRLIATYDDRSISMWNLSIKGGIQFAMEPGAAKKRKGAKLRLDLDEPSGNPVEDNNSSAKFNATDDTSSSSNVPSSSLSCRIKKFVITPLETTEKKADTKLKSRSSAAGLSIHRYPPLISENFQMTLNASENGVMGIGGHCGFPKDSMIACLGPFSNRLVAVLPSAIAARYNNRLAEGVVSIGYSTAGETANAIGSESVVQIAVVFDFSRYLQGKAAKSAASSNNLATKGSKILKFIHHPLHPHLIALAMDNGQIICISTNQDAKPSVGDKLFTFPTSVIPEHARAMVYIDDCKLSLHVFKGSGKCNVEHIRKVDLSYISPWSSGSDPKKATSSFPSWMVWPGNPTVHCFDDEHFRRVRLFAIVWPNVHRFLVFRLFVFGPTKDLLASLIDEGTGVSVAWTPSLTRATIENRIPSASGADSNDSNEQNGFVVKVSTLVIAAQSSNSTPKHQIPSTASRSESPVRGSRKSGVNSSADDLAEQSIGSIKERPPLFMYRHYYLVGKDTDGNDIKPSSPSTSSAPSNYENYDPLAIRVSRAEMVTLGCEPLRIYGGGPLLLASFGRPWTSVKSDNNERTKLDDEFLPPGSNNPMTARSIDLMNKSQFFHWTPLAYTSPQIGVAAETANSVSILDPATGVTVPAGSQRKNARLSNHKLINVGNPLSTPSAIAWNISVVDEKTSYHIALAFQYGKRILSHPQSVHVFCTVGNDMQLRHQCTIPSGVNFPSRISDISFFNGTLFFATDINVQCAFVGFRPDSIKGSLSSTPMVTPSSSLARIRLGSVSGSISNRDETSSEADHQQAIMSSEAQHLVTGVPALQGIRMPENINSVVIASQLNPIKINLSEYGAAINTKFEQRQASMKSSNSIRKYSSRGTAYPGLAQEHTMSYTESTSSFRPVPDYETEENKQMQSQLDNGEEQEEAKKSDDNESFWPQTLSYRPNGSISIIGVVCGTLMVAATREHGVLAPFPINISHPYCRFGSLVSAGMVSEAIKWTLCDPLKKYPVETALFLESRGYIHEACSISRLNPVLILDIHAKHVNIDEAVKFALRVSPRKLLKYEEELKSKSFAYGTYSLSSLLLTQQYWHSVPSNISEAIEWKRLIKKYLNDTSLNAIKRLALLLAYGQSLPHRSGEEGIFRESPSKEDLAIASSRNSSPLAKPRNLPTMIASGRSPIVKPLIQRKGPIHEALLHITEKCLKQKLYDEAKFCALLLNDQSLSRDLGKKAIKGQISILLNDEKELNQNDMEKYDSNESKIKYQTLKKALERELEMLS